MLTALKQKIKEENPHIPFNLETDIVITFMLRGLMDVYLYEENEDRDIVIKALSNTIKVVTNHYRMLVKSGKEF